MTGQIIPNGSVIGEKYRLESPIGSGGFSHVYKATHMAMDRRVAIKIFDPTDQINTDPEKAARRAARFEREAQFVSQLAHPNTVTIYDFGVEDDGKAYLAMEFIEGQTLKQAVRNKGPLDRDEAVTIFLQILASLEEAHHRNILHRDLKPANIMLTTNFKGEQVVKVLDFGIAQMLQKSGEDDSPDSGLFLGTPRYAAPEQLTAQKLSLATDIYGVGALLWQCTVGQPMVPTSDIHECIGHAISPHPWKIPAQAAVDTDIAAIIERAVRKNPVDRYPDAASMMEALEECTSFDREDLPEIREDDFFTQQRAVVDPNITHPDDSQNYFFEDPTQQVDISRSGLPRPPSRPLADPSASSIPAEAATIPAPSDRTNETTSGPVEPTPQPSRSMPRGDQGFSSPSSTRDTSNPEQTPPASRSPRPKTAPRKPTNSLPVIPIIACLGALFLIAALTIGLVLVDDDHDEPQRIDGIAGIDDDEGDDQARPNSASGHDSTDDINIADNSRFSVDGVTVALRTDNWRIRSSDSIERANYSYRPVTAVRNDYQLDVTFFEFQSQQARDEFYDRIEPPELHMTLDHIIVRIVARDIDTEREAELMQSFLESYYQMVAGSGPNEQ